MELADLPLVHQQPLGPIRILVEDVALLIGGDVHTQGEQLTVLGHAVGILQIHPPAPDGLDLRSGQLDARLIALLHEVVVVRLAVLCSDLNATLFHGKRSFPEVWHIVYHVPPLITSPKYAPHC